MLNHNDHLENLMTLIQASVGLDYDQAMPIVYYAICTYGMTELEKFPILAFDGPAGTGKTTLLQILLELAYRPTWIDGKVTKAVLRDRLTLDTTALIDEADGIDEGWLVNRYSRQSSSTDVNRQLTSTSTYKAKEQNLFGATALHRSEPFKDSATLSRSISVNTRSRAGGVEPFRKDTSSPFAAYLEELAKAVQGDQVIEKGGDRISDTWAPLLEVDELLGGAFEPYARQQMERASTSLRIGHQEEPSQAVFQALLAESLLDELLEPEYRVLIADISKRVQLNSWQVGQLLRDIGFKTKTVGGHQWIYTGSTEHVVEIGNLLGLGDEWLKRYDWNPIPPEDEA